MSARVSTRISFRWLPDEPAETSDTLVLNVGAHFVDLRVSLQDQSIEWAMAGDRLILSTDPLKCRWTRVIDSLGEYGDDDGDFSLLPNGDSLEEGSMVSPEPRHDSQVVKYEEVWRNLPVNHDSQTSWILKSASGNGTTFIGRIGEYYIALREQKGQPFVATREEWQESGKWKSKYSIGSTDGVPSLIGKNLSGFEGEKDWQKGQTVKIDGLDFLVLAVGE